MERKNIKISNFNHLNHSVYPSLVLIRFWSCLLIYFSKQRVFLFACHHFRSASRFASRINADAALEGDFAVFAGFGGILVACGIMWHSKGWCQLVRTWDKAELGFGRKHLGF